MARFRDDFIAEHPTWHSGPIFEGMDPDTKAGYTDLYIAAVYWMKGYLSDKSTKFLPEDEALKYVGMLSKHILPIIIRLRHNFNIDYTDFNSLVKEILTTKVEEVADDKRKYLSDLGIDVDIEIIRAINEVQVRRIARLNGFSDLEIEHRIHL